MNAQQMWNKFKDISGIDHDEYEAWAFGMDADELAGLVLKGEKTATASAYPLYAVENEPLPQCDDYSVILNARGEAVCVIKNTRVYMIPFCEVSEAHAAKEGEGDKSLVYWRKVHEAFFRKCMSEAGLAFTEDMLVVCEEFEIQYALGAFSEGEPSRQRSDA